MKKILAAFLAMLMILSLCACGSNSSTYSSADAAEYSTEDYYEADTAFYAESTDNAGSGVGTADATAETTGSASDDGIDSEKIIYCCYAEIETRNFEESCAEIAALITRYGGFLESSSVRGADYYSDGHRSADYTIRIPRETFQQVTQNLSTLGNVPYCTTTAENISSSYYDTESRLETYEVEQERLISMLEMCDNVEDMLSIEDRLADVRYHIESLTTTLQNWDGLVSYSTLSIYLEEVSVYTETVERGYWERMADGFMTCLEGVGSFFKNAFLVIVAILPVLVVLGVVAVVVVLLVKPGKKRRAEKRLASPAKQKPSAQAEYKPINEDKK